MFGMMGTISLVARDFLCGDALDADYPRLAKSAADFRMLCWVLVLVAV